MLAYLSAETTFLRAFGNRSLLLIILCALARTSDSLANSSIAGVSLAISPALIIVTGPILALILLIAMKIEADTLLLSREAVLDEATKLTKRWAMSAWLYVFFVLPLLAGAFLTVQFIIELVPEGLCGHWSWLDQLFSISRQSGTPSTFCIRDKVFPGQPWIYPPLQTYIYIGCVAGCAYLTYKIVMEWHRARGAQLGRR